MYQAVHGRARCNSFSGRIVGMKGRMFTGIITHTGKFKNALNNQFEFEVPQDFLKKISIGSSVAVDGVCLTVKQKNKSVFFDVMEETLKKTILGRLEAGNEVNLELPLTPVQYLSGHIVQGHVDGIGRVKGKGLRGKSQILKIIVPNTLSKYIVQKGSISVNGVSLTVIEAGNDYFTVGIIPFTLKNTSFGGIKMGDLVNIEVDILAKYIEKLIKK